MPPLRLATPSENRVVAVLVSDLHLSHVAPLARSVEEDWYEVMGNYLDQVKGLEEKHGCPVVISGDLFNRWEAPSELITFAMRRLPDNVYAVPGNHDLPNHAYSDMHKSAFGVLVQAERIHLIRPGAPVVLYADQIRLYGFPCGFPLTPCKNQHGLFLEVAVVHDYVFMKGHDYPGAPREKSVASRYEALKTYHACVFGDNHKGFLYEDQDVNLINVGSFMRRKQDEKNYRPMVGLLYNTGKIAPYYLDVSRDRFLEKEELEKLKVGGKNVREVIEEIKSLGDVVISYEEGVKRWISANSPPPDVERIMLSSVESHAPNKSNGD